MSEEGRVEAPERIRVCVRAGKADWIGVAYADETADPSAIHEYIRAQPPTADAEMVAREIVREWEETSHSHVFANDARDDLTRRITTALSAARQQGRDEQRERDARLAENYKGGFTVDVMSGVLINDPDGPWSLPINIAATIRSNQ